MLNLHNAILILVLAPLVGSIIAGLAGKQIGRQNAHRATILGIGISLLCASFVGKLYFLDHISPEHINLYTWAATGSFTFNVGFLIDPLSALMLIVVTFVSFLVHVYSIGYMSDDPGYQRFFSYISLFTFAMLCLVLADNFLVLFFGWEGVGLVSYLLIGFWFKRESALVGSLKAFIVNRVGDFGFVLGIGAILTYFGSIDYATVFSMAPSLAARNETIMLLPNMPCAVVSVICILLFIGAMGKSAQVPLHVWLPESMEGPTPISALIHAATMVTAGIYMVARMSPLFELSPSALSLVLIIGSTGALFLGLLGIVQNDIKRVVAYSTLSQLGYMMAALGASAFTAGIFHLFTHAFFKALLFLAAGSVIIGMHHEQDMRKMGGLYKYMPITYFTFLLGSLSLSAIPPFSGFYSKDAIIEAIHGSTIFGSHYAYICVLLGAFVTALYTFRAFFLTFHTKERMDHHTREHLHESPWVVWLPLVILAIPSVGVGAWLAGSILYTTDGYGLLGHSIFVAERFDVMAVLAEEYPGAMTAAIHAFHTAPFWLAIAGILVAFLSYQVFPAIPHYAVTYGRLFYNILMNKFWFDQINEIVFVRGGRKLGDFLYKIGDVLCIDGWFVNGSGALVKKMSSYARRIQTGYLYHYVFIMVIGLVIFLLWLLIIR